MAGEQSMDIASALERWLDTATQFASGGEARFPLALAFLAVFLGVLAVSGLLAAGAPIRRAARDDIGESGSLRSQAAPKTRWGRVLEPFETSLLGRLSGRRPTLGTRLRRAGFVDPGSPRNHVLLRIFLSLAAPAIFLLVAPLVAADAAFVTLAAVAAGLAISGSLLPELRLAYLIQRRRRVIMESFPDALDLMVVCVESGLGIDAALIRVARRIAALHPFLAAELDWMALELRAGKSREDALRNFAERVAHPQIASFATLLIESDRLGTSAARTLRAHAVEMRALRLLRAEERARKLPVKLTIPLVVCVLPAMLAVVLLPGLIGIARTLLPQLGN